MLLNWKEVNLLLKELNLKNSIIRQIYQPVHSIVLFELYKPESSFTLLFSLSPSNCRFHSTSRKFKNPDRPQRFASFLRAHIRGGRIIDAYQVMSERIVKIIVKKSMKVLYVWVRLWGGAANMIVTETDGKILDACYRRTKKGEVSGGFFNPEKNLSKDRYDEGKKDRYEIRKLPGDGSFNNKIEKYFFEKENINEKQKLLNFLEKNYNETEAYFLSQMSKIEKQKQEYSNYNRYKELGDIIMGSIQLIKKGAKWLVAKDFYNNNQKIEIELDINLLPQDNAKKYYEKYRNAKTGLFKLEQKASHLKYEIDKINNKRKVLKDNTDMESLKSQEAALRKNRPQIAAVSPGLTFYSSNYKIIVGRTAQENDTLLRRYMQGNDFWFHSRDYPGAYIFVKYIHNKSIPLQVMLDAGNLALFYSKGKASGKGDVYYTQVKYLKRIRSGRTGMVNPTHEKNLYIVIDEKRIERLKNSKELY